MSTSTNIHLFLPTCVDFKKSSKNLTGIFYQMDHIWWALSRLKKMLALIFLEKLAILLWQDFLKTLYFKRLKVLLCLIFWKNYFFKSNLWIFYMKVKFWKILYFERLSLYFESNETHVSFLMILIRGMGKSTFLTKTNQTKPGFFFLSELDEIWYAQISSRFPTACKIWGQSEVIWGQRPKFRASIICRVY